MKRHFIVLVFLFLSVHFFFGCSKDFSNENATGVKAVAQGTLYDSAGNCQKIYVNGDYYFNTPMNNRNYILLKVNLTNAGKYDIKTNTVNGFWFRDSGYFNDIGVQQVQLFGYGTPNSIKNARFTVSFNTASCGFSINNITDTTTGGLSNALFSLVDSAGNCTQAKVNGTYTKNIVLNSSNTAVIQINVSRLGSYAFSTNQVNGITFSSSGFFTALGMQTLTLQASGTPLSSGNYTIPIVSGTSNCSFVVAVK